MTDNEDKMRKGGTRGGIQTMAPEYKKKGLVAGFAAGKFQKYLQ
jgi:hypothetical protein